MAPVYRVGNLGCALFTHAINNAITYDVFRSRQFSFTPRAYLVFLLRVVETET